MSMESHGGMILKGKTEGLGEKSLPVKLSPSETPYGLTRARTQASNVVCGGRMRWPRVISNEKLWKGTN
jgi:hypothetical protein